MESFPLNDFSSEKRLGTKPTEKIRQSALATKKADSIIQYLQEDSLAKYDECLEIVLTNMTKLLRESGDSKESHKQFGASRPFWEQFEKLVAAHRLAARPTLGIEGCKAIHNLATFEANLARLCQCKVSTGLLEMMLMLPINEVRLAVVTVVAGWLAGWLARV